MYLKYCIFHNVEQVKGSLQYLNFQHSNIRFTHKKEENYSLPFLDVLITHSDSGFSTNLYRKKTYSGLYTNFESFSPIQYKVNLISVLIYRAYHICSSNVAFHEQVVKIKRFLQYNRSI